MEKTRSAYMLFYEPIKAKQPASSKPLSDTSTLIDTPASEGKLESKSSSTTNTVATDVEETHSGYVVPPYLQNELVCRLSARGDMSQRRALPTAHDTYVWFSCTVLSNPKERGTASRSAVL